MDIKSKQIQDISITGILTHDGTDYYLVKLKIENKWYQFGNTNTSGVLNKIGTLEPSKGDSVSFTYKSLGVDKTILKGDPLSFTITKQAPAVTQVKTSDNDLVMLGLKALITIKRPKLPASEVDKLAAVLLEVILNHA